MFTDTHVHLTDPLLLPQLREILARARAAKVERMLCICSSLNALRAALTMNEEGLYLASAIPPHDAESPDETFFQEIAQHAKRFVAIGETGLDNYHKDSPKQAQEKLLLRHVELAQKHALPLLFHCRNAFSDLFRHSFKSRCLLHCFTGTLEDMQEAVRRNWLISFSGIVTYKNGANLREIAKETPLENIVIETDAPYLAPQSKRGTTNEPAFMVETATLLAELKGVSLEEFARATTENFLKFIGADRSGP